MSSEDGVYIFSSKGEDGIELRVACVQAIGNVVAAPGQLDCESAVKYFGKSPVFTDCHAAYAAAQALLHESLEYRDVVWIHLFAHLPFPAVSNP